MFAGAKVVDLIELLNGFWLGGWLEVSSEVVDFALRSRTGLIFMGILEFLGNFF